MKRLEHIKKMVLIPHDEYSAWKDSRLKGESDTEVLSNMSGGGRQTQLFNPTPSQKLQGQISQNEINSEIFSKGKNVSTQGKPSKDIMLKSLEFLIKAIASGNGKQVLDLTGKGGGSEDKSKGKESNHIMDREPIIHGEEFIGLKPPPPGEPVFKKKRVLNSEQAFILPQAGSGVTREHPPQLSSKVSTIPTRELKKWKKLS